MADIPDKSSLKRGARARPLRAADVACYSRGIYQVSYLFWGRGIHTSEEMVDVLSGWNPVLLRKRRNEQNYVVVNNFAIYRQCKRRGFKMAIQDGGGSGIIIGGECLKFKALVLDKQISSKR